MLVSACPGGQAVATMSELNGREQSILDFERGWWLVPGSKEVAIREVLGVSPGSYYRVLRDLLDDPAALEYDPLTVKRLRRRRDLRRRERVEGPRVGRRPR